MNGEKIFQTPSQTVGPFFAYGLTAAQYGYDYNSIIDGTLTNDNATGEKICVIGNVFDGNGKAIPDAMIELCHADSLGKYVKQYPDIPMAQIPFKGFGRLGTGTDSANQFKFITIKPGAIKGHAPHINVILFMRGSLRSLYTRIYFSDVVNDKDPLLNSVAIERRHTLIAERKEANGITYYHFDIHLQGEEETVFFDV